MPDDRIDHDGLFKRLLTTFFFEFVELFLPQLSAYVGRERVEFLDKEIFTDVLGNDHHEVDLIAKVKFREKDVFFLIHVENQSSPSIRCGIAGVAGADRRALRAFAGRSRCGSSGLCEPCGRRGVDHASRIICINHTDQRKRPASGGPFSLTRFSLMRDPRLTLQRLPRSSPARRACADSR
ncbi:MAG: cytoplasmic protein [Phycisphaerales bacterium]|nr:cytoplasmic protein [Phycisphaerales bacterium]